MTALWTGETLATALGGELLPGCAGVECGAVSIDTRTLPAGALFVALVGEHGDGHRFLADAFSRGATAALVHQREAPGVTGCRVLVPDTLAGLAALGLAGRARFAGRVIAVTGSVGKTTTKEMLRAALAPLGAVHAAEASYNNHWGVPLTLARLPADAAFCICEIGTNHPGEIAPLAAMVRPDAAIITAIGTSHLGNMGSVEAIAREKSELFRSLRRGGVAVLPADSRQAELLAHAVPEGARMVRFGTGAGAAARLLGVDGDHVRAVIAGRALSFRLAAPGLHMAANAVAVLAAIAALGLDVEAAAGGLARFRPGPGRGETRPLLRGGATLLDESYNASGDSVRAALDVLRLLPARRRIAAIGDMLELGAFAQAEHEALAGPLATVCDLVFACGPHSRALFDRLPAEKQGGWAADSAALAPLVAPVIRGGDAVLVKGSHGSRMRLVVDLLLGLDHTP